MQVMVLIIVVDTAATATTTATTNNNTTNNDDTNDNRLIEYRRALREALQAEEADADCDECRG